METTIDTFTDSRDGKTYKTVKIGEQVWMAENLAFECEGAKCYGNELEDAEKYGLLYDWETAKKVAPKGWHLPTNEEWQKLIDYVCDETISGKNEIRDSETAGKHLKAASGWNEDGDGTNDFGFSALPGGWCHPDGTFTNVVHSGGWWTATEYFTSLAYYRYMYYNYDFVYLSYYDRAYLFSVRCVKD